MWRCSKLGPIVCNILPHEREFRMNVSKNPTLRVLIGKEVAHDAIQATICPSNVDLETKNARMGGGDRGMMGRYGRI